MNPSLRGADEGLLPTESQTFVDLTPARESKATWTNGPLGTHEDNYEGNE